MRSSIRATGDQRPSNRTSRSSRLCILASRLTNASIFRHTHPIYSCTRAIQSVSWFWAGFDYAWVSNKKSHWTCFRLQRFGSRGGRKTRICELSPRHSTPSTSNSPHLRNMEPRPQRIVAASCWDLNINMPMYTQEKEMPPNTLASSANGLLRYGLTLLFNVIMVMDTKKRRWHPTLWPAQ